jgi:putative glutamine amidotransferase
LYTPLIGITTAHLSPAKRRWSYHASPTGYTDAIIHAGGLPVLIPLGIPVDALRQIYERVDGVLLSGGVDVNPQRYGAEPHPLTQEPDDLRDEAEITLANWASAEDRPVLGICRGHQVLNVALGGTLIQDVPSLMDTPITHDVDNSRPGGNYVHTVQINPASRLVAIFDKTTLTVNSMHHQSLRQPGPGVHITAHSPDGVIEATEVPSKQFVLSVQWHPEEMFAEDADMQRLFKAFVDAARERSGR